ncbi:MAG: rRNA maturation RNase YbeY [Gammaproteobacteria bacterium]|nr:rRNA maturation RNase YbeY [Gammaproteobacteria bacterium]
MKWTLQIATEPEPELPKRSLFKPAMNLLSQEFDLTQHEICIRIVKPEESQQLNKQFRGKDNPTNVLSFPFEEERYLGDLALCHPVIQAEAKNQNKSIRAHYQHLLIHGVLHLLGFDHENEADATEMEQIEIELLAQLNLANPYEAPHD